MWLSGFEVRLAPYKGLVSTNWSTAPRARTPAEQCPALSDSDGPLRYVAGGLERGTLSLLHVVVQRFAAVEAGCDIEGLTAGSHCGRMRGEKTRSADEDVVAFGTAGEVAVLT